MVADDVTGDVGGLVDDVTETAGEAVDTVGDAVDGLGDTVDDVTADLDDVVDGLTDTVDERADTVGDVAEGVGDEIDGLTGTVGDVADAVAAAGVPGDLAQEFWDVTRENITTLNDLPQWWALVSQGAEPVVAPEDAEFIAEAMALLPQGPLDGDSWGQWTSAVKDATGRKGKALFMPLRLAVTGQAKGPDMASFLPLLQVIKARSLAK